MFYNLKFAVKSPGVYAKLRLCNDLHTEAALLWIWGLCRSFCEDGKIRRNSGIVSFSKDFVIFRSVVLNTPEVIISHRRTWLSAWAKNTSEYHGDFSPKISSTACFHDKLRICRPISDSCDIDNHGSVKLNACVCHARHHTSIHWLYTAWQANWVTSSICVNLEKSFQPVNLCIKSVKAGIYQTCRWRRQIDSLSVNVTINVSRQSSMLKLSQFH